MDGNRQLDYGDGSVQRPQYSDFNPVGGLVDDKADDGIYYCTSLDLKGLGLSGTLDVSALKELKYLNCSDNNYDVVNINNCTKLENAHIAHCPNVTIQTSGSSETELQSDTSLDNLKLLESEINIRYKTG